jgi:hypothetical protein
MQTKVAQNRDAACGTVLVTEALVAQGSCCHGKPRSKAYPEKQGVPSYNAGLCEHGPCSSYSVAYARFCLLPVLRVQAASSTGGGEAAGSSGGGARRRRQQQQQQQEQAQQQQTQQPPAQQQPQQQPAQAQPQYLYEPSYGLPVVRRRLSYSELLRDIRLEKVSEVRGPTGAQHNLLAPPCRCFWLWLQGSAALGAVGRD